MSERKKIKEQLDGHISLSDFEGNIDSVISKLNDYKTRYSDYHDLFLDSTVEYDYYCEGGTQYYELYGYRYETDKELAKRIHKEDCLKKKKLKKDKTVA